MDQDFFGIKPEAANLGDDVDTFAKAISERSILNPAMKAKALAPLKPKFPLPSNNLKPSSSFAFIEPIRLSSLINTASAIIIDIRPHAAYSSARIPTALSLSVPSTLLKRPLFSLDRLAAMLPSSSARARFTEWPKFTTIIVYDVDSTGSPFLPEGNNILGLLRKFSNDAAYSGNTLLWLKGGFQRVWREHRDLVDFHPPEPEAEDEANETGSLKTTHLPSKAFGSGTTTRNSLDLSSPRKRLPSRLSLRSNAPRMSDNKPSVTSSIPFNPFFDTIRQNIELTHGVTERIPLRLPKRVRKRIDDLPFEWLREISRRADVKHEDAFSSEGDDSTSSISEIESHPRPSEFSRKVLPPSSHREHEHPTSSDNRSSSNMSKEQITPLPPDQGLLEQGMEALATQFYHIELAEQKRLMGVMKHHSAESGVVTSQIWVDRKDSVVESADPSAASESRPTNMFLEDVERISADSGASSRSLPPSAPSIAGTPGSSYAHNYNKPGNGLSGPTVPPSISGSDSDRGRGSNSAKYTFPYSITAGVEKGAKNRYRHIWPFEHARVRLHLRRLSPSRKSSKHEDFSNSLDTFHSTVSFPSLPPSSVPSIRPSGALTGPISSFSGPATSGTSISRSTSDVTKFPRSPSRLKNRRGAKPSFGAGGLGGIPPPAFNFSSSALTAPVLPGFSASTISGSALKPSFTRMRAPPPAAGSGGDTTESEHEHDDSEKEASGRDEPKSEEHDDYVNASYVQPLCTTRRYIATQGPLEATFIDFWTLVYQQNVHVIVMLTREIEGSMVKCGPYWKDEVFGPLRLKLILTEGNVDEGKDDDVRRKVGGGDPGVGGFFFSSPSMSDTKRDKKKKGTKNPADAIIKRTFLLSHVGYPDIPPRKVVQFQYLEWPDMNVPDDPRGVLGLIREVDQAVTEAMHLNRQGEAEGQAVNEAIPDNMDAGVSAIVRPSLSNSRSGSEESLNRYTGIANNAMGRKQSPVLLHCSAGVGRTGGFIAVDAVLDGVRRELRKTKNSSSQHGQSGSITLAKLPDAMDVDINNEEQAVEDGQGNWNRTGNTDSHMADRKTELQAVAIPANNCGNILHVTVHHPSMVRSSSYLFRISRGQGSNDDLLTPTAPFPTVPFRTLHASQDTMSESDNPTNPTLGSPIHTSMHVSDINCSPTLTTDNTGSQTQPAYPRQLSTTRMWAEDVSDQTGSHGTAFRVDDAMRHMYFQDRLNEWDVPNYNLKAPNVAHTGETTRVSSGDIRSMQVNLSHSSHRPTSLVPERSIGTGFEDGSASPSAFPLSSIDSASSSADSYGFQSGFKSAHHHGSLPYGESALTSSTGTSFSSLQSLPGSAMPNLSTLQVIGGGQPSLHGEGNRVRTWSAPSVRHKQVETGEPGGKHLQGNKVVADTASPFVPSPLVFGDHSRAVEKSPSSFPNFRRDESTLLSHPSRSLSPNHLDAQSVPPNLRPSAGGTDKDKNSGINVVNHPLFTSSDSLAFPTSTWNTTVSESHTDSAETGTNSRPSTSTTKATSLPTYSNHVPVRFQGAGKRDTDHLPFTEGVLTSVSQHRRTDFSYPRVLHNDHSPQALSNLEEPLMEVLQDMREQRMSLCQSLRQYVFVHAAVIEGALMIVDEERERERKEMSMNVDDDALMRWSTVSSFPGPPSMFSPLRYTRGTKGADSVPSTPSTGKRVASPTELPKTDKKGDQMLFKKPSIKKKQVLRSRSPQNEMS